MATSTLKILREVNDYTQDYIAEEVLGISKSTYARLEQDPSKINAAHAQRLADLYNVSLANLLSEATPIITFKDSVKANNNGTTGYQHSNTNNFHEGEVKALKEQNELLIKQNAELMELVKALGGKLAGGNDGK
ncbi:MAG: helix-turn-helix transcriptional regulator [Chitinophagaceae bacterium]|nr:helix-turn-helix transcriptional regulator [Chitinophagaceae bacterium]